MEPNYSVLVGVVVMIESLGNNRGVVERVSGDGRDIRVRVKTGALRGQLLLTDGSDVTPLQPPTNLDSLEFGFVKVLDGPQQTRVGILIMMIEVGDDDSPRVEGIVRFPERDSVVLPLSFLACWNESC